MQSPHSTLARLSDDELLVEVKRLAASERLATADLIASLAEVDHRRLYLAAGYSSLFTYCVRALGLSEDAAYFRIEAARAAGRFPLILERLGSGSVTLTAVKLLAPHLTPENHVALLDEARGQTRRNVEEIVARVAPKPDAPAMVRKLPAARWTSTAGPTSKSIKTPTAGGRTSVERSNVASTPALPTQCCTELFSPQGGGDAPLGAVHASEPQPSAPDVNAANSSPAAIFCPAAIRPAVVVPIAPERYKVQVTVDAATHATLRRLQDLLRHEIPDGDPATIIARALALLLEQVGRRKYAATRGRVTKEKTAHASQLKLGSERVDPMIPDKTDKQRSKRTRTTHARRSRYIPATVRRTVWLRDEGRCTFVGTDGRCPETAMLEYHHAIPFADRGEATASNLRLTCRRHNKLEADRFFGTADPCEGP